MTTRSIRSVLLAASMLAASPALATDVTPDRLANPDKEPQNWLMNHRTYDAQRYSPLARIDRNTVKNLKLAYSVAIGGTSVNENLQATPLAEDGFLYVVDVWGVVYKIDGRSGDSGRGRTKTSSGPPEATTGWTPSSRSVMRRPESWCERIT